jgi:hypothetical protein
MVPKIRRFQTLTGRKTWSDDDGDVEDEDEDEDRG